MLMGGYAMSGGSWSLGSHTSDDVTTLKLIVVVASVVLHTYALDKLAYVCIVTAPGTMLTSPQSVRKFASAY